MNDELLAKLRVASASGDSGADVAASLLPAVRARKRARKG